MSDDNNALEFIKFPKSVLQLSDEVKRAVDLYWNRGLEEDKLKKLIYTWANTGLLLKGSDLNKTVKKIIGKKRQMVVLKMLEGYQFRI